MNRFSMSLDEERRPLSIFPAEPGGRPGELHEERHSQRRERLLIEILAATVVGNSESNVIERPHGLSLKMASNTSLHHLAREVTNRPRRAGLHGVVIPQVTSEHTGACGRSWRWQGSNVSAVKLIRFLAAASLFVVGVMIVLYGLL